MKAIVAGSRAAACAAAAAVALTAAAPAQADPPLLDGIYVMDGGGDGFYFVISSSCVANVCTANMSSNRGWSTQGTFNNGRWYFNVVKPDGVVCEDNSYAPVVVDYSIDAVTLEGTLTSDSNGGCPGGQVTDVPFRLHRVGNS